MTQLDVTITLDDASLLEVAPAEVGWAVLSGPLAGIDRAGVATAAAVAADAEVEVEATLGGATGTGLIGITDVNPDNYLEYAGDGIGDRAAELGGYVGELILNIGHFSEPVRPRGGIDTPRRRCSEISFPTVLTTRAALTRI